MVLFQDVTDNEGVCPECRALELLKTIKESKIIEVIRVIKKRRVEEIIKDLINIYKEYKSKAPSEPIFRYSDKAKEYAWEIVEYIVWHPGTLIYFEDSHLMDEAKNIITELWESIDYDELSDEMFSGGFSGLMVNIIGDYIERAKKIKPIFITVKPTDVIRTYFQEAMNAWCYGLNTAALILCCSILESILKEVLLRKDPKFVYDMDNGKGFQNIKEKDLKILIDNAKQAGLLDDIEIKKAQMIRESRNAAVHKLKRYSSEQTYQAIITTKELIEKLLT